MTYGMRSGEVEKFQDALSWASLLSNVGVIFGPSPFIGVLMLRINIIALLSDCPLQPSSTQLR